MARKGGGMARVVRKHRRLGSPQVKILSPKVVSVSATIPFDGTVYSRFGYMEKCFKCGFKPLVDIKDANLMQVVKRYCSGCNTEWVR